MATSAKRFKDFDTSNPTLAEQNRLDLPPGAQERYSHFRNLDLKAKGFIKARSERIAELNGLIQEQQQQQYHTGRDIERSGKQPGHYVDKGEGRQEFVAANWQAPYQTKIAGYKAEIARLQKEPTPSTPLASIDEFLGTVRGLPADAELPPVQLKAGKNLGDLYARATASTDAAYEKLSEIVGAPKPSEFVLPKVRAEIARLAHQGRPRLGEHFAGGRVTEMHGKFVVGTPHATIGWPMQHLAFDSEGEQVASFDALKTIAWLFESELTEAVEKLVRERARDSKAIHPDDKPGLIDKAQRAVIDALRFETEIALECERTGITVERRKNVPAPILLGLEVAPGVIDPAESI